LLLYGTGLRIGEAVGLNLADVDLDSGILCIREAKFYRTRLVPTGPDLTSVLAQYAAERNKWPSLNPDAAFLLTERGQRLSRAGAEYAFKQLRERAQVRRDDSARYQPRLHDLRHNSEAKIIPSAISIVVDMRRRCSTELGNAAHFLGIILLSPSGNLSGFLRRRHDDAHSPRWNNLSQ
jgi:integrase